MPTPTEQFFLEDFRLGETFAGSPRKLTEADVLGFAALTGDAHPIHYDDDYAKRTRFGQPIVHGLHLMALTALGATPLSERLEDSLIALLEQQAAFCEPAFKDDVVRPEFEIEQINPRPGREWGTLTMKVRLTNQRGEIILEGRHVYGIRHRAVTAAGGA